jgi:hypothetical protein
MKTTTFLLCLFGLFLGNCTQYQWLELPTSRIKKLDNNPKLSFYLVDSANPSTSIWFMTDCVFSETEITCTVAKMTEIEASNVMMMSRRKYKVQSRDDIMFYTGETLVSELPVSGTATIPLTKLAKIEVCERDQIKTIGGGLLFTMGMVGLLLVLSIY